jgi:hypothetical protein
MKKDAYFYFKMILYNEQLDIGPKQSTTIHF